MRVTSSVQRHARKKKVLKQAEGFRGRRKNCYGLAIDAVVRSHTNAYTGRILRKRNMRRLFITRLNASVVQHGISYSQFIHKYHTLAKNNNTTPLNRKSLSEIAIHYPEHFANIVQGVIAN